LTSSSTLNLTGTTLTNSGTFRSTAAGVNITVPTVTNTGTIQSSSTSVFTASTGNLSVSGTGSIVAGSTITFNSTNGSATIAQNSLSTTGVLGTEAGSFGLNLTTGGVIIGTT